MSHFVFRLLKKGVLGLIYPLCFLYPYNAYKCIIQVRAFFRTTWLKYYIKSVGEKVSFGRIGYLKDPNYIFIGNNTSFGDYFYLTAWPEYGNPEIRIGNDCSFGAFNHITSINRIVIGDGCLTGKWVTITDNSHGETDLQSLMIPPQMRPVISKGHVIIGKNVWIGDKVTILPNVTIGDSSVIAANTVVTHDVPAFCVVAGNPGKIIKQY